MKKHLVLLLGLWTAMAASSSTVTGDWLGALDTGNGALKVVVHISQAQDDSLTGTLDSPDQGATGIAMTSISYKQPDLHFEIAQFGSSYDGKLNIGNSEISGQWTQGKTSLSLTFKRVKERL